LQMSRAQGLFAGYSGSASSLHAGITNGAHHANPDSVSI
jgi:hypothetical protein